MQKFISSTQKLPVAHVPPQAPEVETLVLGAALIESNACHTLLATISNANVFYIPAHQCIFQAISNLAADGQPVDNVTVVQQLRKQGVLERIGGVAFVARLSLHIHSGANLEGHCRILLQEYARRTVIHASNDLLSRAYDHSLDPLELLTTAQNQLTRLHHTLETHAGQTAADTFADTFAQLEWAVQAEGLTGVPTGLSDLDGLTGGWQPSDLIIVAARPGVGKTAVLLHFARTAALDNHLHAAIFSLEMSRLQLMQRLIASEVPGYSTADLRCGRLSGGLEEVAHIRHKAARLHKQGHLLHIDDTPGLPIQQLRAKCARLHAKRPLDLILVDYLQLMRGERGNNNTREREVSSISQGLKELAKELNVPVIVLSQLSRDVEKRGGDKRPQLSDLRESGSLEQDADCIIFLWRGDYNKINEYSDGTPTADTMIFDVAKHRNGALDTITAACSMRRNFIGDFVPAYS
jgi:replicative DNA helicase